MQNAETVLGVLRERGRRGLPVNELYRQMFNPELYLLAYGRIYSNQGSMTPGVTTETVDGMSMRKIDRIIDAMRHERYRFSPARRIYIPKKNGKMRPLGMPTWSDKLVGEVLRLLLEAYYEPTFSDSSHGFRPNKGCHTALREVATNWTATTWFLEVDIADCFGSLDHGVMMSTLADKIHDNRFLRLIEGMLTAGYLQDWVWNATLSGTPQGGIASPILSNIYLNRLDAFVEGVLIPEYTRGALRTVNPEFRRISDKLGRSRSRGDRARTRQLRQQLRTLPSKDPDDPKYRRLRYVRYADDQLLGFTGPRSEAEQIKQRLGQFLRDDLKLEMTSEKTLISHARTQPARFLGYDVLTQHSSTRRRVNGNIALRVPRDVIRAKSVPYLRRGKPAHRSEWINEGDYTIVSTYGSIYRGIVQYYLLAQNVSALYRLTWVMQTSMLRTLAAKHRSSAPKMMARFTAKIETPEGIRQCFEAKIERPGREPLVGRFGGIPLQRKRTAVLVDRQPSGVMYPTKELITRFLAGKCELCASTDDIHVHHVARLADLVGAGPQPVWSQVMKQRRRKTLVVCGQCYDTIRTGLQRPARSGSLES